MEKACFFDSSGCFTDPLKKTLLHCIGRIYPNLELTGISCAGDAFKIHATAQSIKNCDAVFIWNGSEIGCFWVKEICKNFNIPYCVFERGLFPQSSSNFVVDKEGICCRSESLKKENLDKSEINKNLKIVKKHYINNKLERKKAKNKVVFVFQLEFDSTVYHYSQYKNNEQMVDFFVEKNKINKEDVIICPHPRNRSIKSKYTISNKRTIKECEDAELAVGISSTTMYEIAGMGCPVEVLGGNESLIHPINRSWKNKEDVLCCILQNQFDVSDKEESIKEKINKNVTR
jgi:hypothetical protein